VRSRGIVFVSHSGERTGAPVVLSRLFRWAVTGAHEDAYLVFRYAGPLAEACGREFPGRVFVVARTSPRALSRLAKPFRKGRDLVRLVRLLRRLRPAVVVVSSLINSLAIVAGRLVGAKVVLWVHEVPGAANDPLALRSRLNRRAHVGLGVSTQSCDALRAIGFPPTRIDRLPHGLDLAAWAAAGTASTGERAPGAGLTLGALAVWSPNKRPDLVLETVIAVAAARPGVPVELWLGGPEDAEAPGLLARTRARHATLPPNLRVRVLGPVEDAARFYQGLDALLVTSDREALPTVVLEALASGVPTFSFQDLPGVREILGEGPALAATRSGAALAATVVDFFYRAPQPATLRAWRETARVRARQFSLETQWQALRAILARIR
jgi:glycosyltransferase involved in cell wall biosynthesis